MLHIFTLHIFSVYGFQTYICNENEHKLVLTTDFNNFHFLRFNYVFLFYDSGLQSIDDKLYLLQNQLQLFKTAFSDLKEFTLSAKIDKNDRSQFNYHTQLLDHIREKLLPICDSSPVYFFHVDFQSNNDGAADFIAQVLQMRPINRCRVVYFYYANETFIQLPVGVISNWLNSNSDGGIGCTGTGQSGNERFLRTNSRIKIQNAVEICDHLKIVRTFYFSLAFKIS